MRMLLRFSLKNYKTFKDQAVFSLVASNYDKQTREEENVFDLGQFGLRILRTAAIYGANASGKSKLLEAFAFARHFIIHSSREALSGDEIELEPFKLSTETENNPSEFEITFIQDEVLYRYGFEATKERVVAEWLYYRPKTKEIELFYRDGRNFEVHERSFSKGKAVVKEGLVRDNALLLTVAAQFNDQIATNVVEWFRRSKVLSGLNESGYRAYTMGRTKELSYKSRILELMKAADLGIQDIQLQKLDPAKLPKDMPGELRDLIVRQFHEEHAEVYSDVTTIHNKFDSEGKLVDRVHFLLDEEESSGTRKFFALAGPVLDVLENGYTLFVDELESKLHPNLVCQLIALFSSKELNSKNAQLVFNTHDTNLLSSGLFRRDQIWFTEKNRYGEAKLYSLADFKSEAVRKSESYEDNYIRGKYGAVPYTGYFEELKEMLSQYAYE
jgi:AAA15 family ATPase/GTPase